MPRHQSLNSFEATYQQLAVAWIDAEIVSMTETMASGAALTKGNVAEIALEFARDVHRIRAFQDVKAQLLEIERQLSGA